ncbi:hypothetical protein D3C78_1221640 [compost metagenome]
MRNTSRSPVSPASIKEGYRLAAAVPEVTMTATGSRDAFARPSAKWPSPRSSKWVWQIKDLLAAAASVNGVERDPGAIQTCRTPWRASASNSNAAHRRLKTLVDIIRSQVG